MSAVTGSIYNGFVITRVLGCKYTPTDLFIGAVNGFVASLLVLEVASAYCPDFKF